MLFLQNITYIHPGKEQLFSAVHLNLIRHEKAALIGNNGVGKSTLLNIIAGKLTPLEGHITIAGNCYYVPQIFGQYNHLTIAEALQIDGKLNALQEILEGKATEANFIRLGDDWTIEERCREALQHWQLEGFDLTRKMASLSGGQKTKVFLAGISVHQPELVLLDEPSNHLDLSGRSLLYDFILSTSCTLLVVSHDRKLLNLLNKVLELSKRGIRLYGGNYDHYLEQKAAESENLNQDLKSKEKALRKAKEKERETLERQERLDARGKKKQEKAGVARIMMNTLRDGAEKSTSKLKRVHDEKIDEMTQDLQTLRKALPEWDKMKFNFYPSSLHQGKVLFKAISINIVYQDQPLWKENLNMQISSGERIALKGTNGSGKTSLLKLLLGTLEPSIGKAHRAEMKSVYVDQDYSLIRNEISVYEQVQYFNEKGLQEHELKGRLHYFLFSKEDWEKPCVSLSGGEKMRLLLCCLLINQEAPDLIVLDEPTNNLDIQNIHILTTAINEYQGTLLVVSHDESFLDEIHIERVIQL